MDYDNINSRLKRLYLSVDQQYEDDVLEHMQTRTEVGDDGMLSVIFDFRAKHDEDETVNRINGIISGLANLKDHFKKVMQERGGDPQVIEDEIDKELPLQVILDLNNQEKHGYPLTKYRRSKKDPKIVDIDKAITARPGVVPTAFIRNPITGAGATNNMTIVITAKIVDGSGNLLYYLNDLVDRSLNAWEGIMAKLKLN